MAGVRVEPSGGLGQGQVGDLLEVLDGDAAGAVARHHRVSHRHVHRCQLVGQVVPQGLVLALRQPGDEGAGALGAGATVTLGCGVVRGVRKGLGVPCEADRRSGCASASARARATSSYSLRLLQRVKELDAAMFTKSGIMVGLGERREGGPATHGRSAFRRGRLLTVGQYLQPTRKHAEVKRFVPPDEFEGLLDGDGGGQGLPAGLAASPLTRSSATTPAKTSRALLSHVAASHR